MPSVSPTGNVNAVLNALRRDKDAMRRLTKARKGFSGEKPSKLSYIGMGCTALFKDIFDFVGGALPGISFIITFMCSTIIAILLFLNQDAKQHRTQVYGILLFVSLLEGIAFGLNFLPLETLTIFILYKLAYSAWKKAQKKEQMIQSKMKELKDFGPMSAMFMRRQTEEEKEIEREAHIRIMEERGEGQHLRNEENRRQARLRLLREHENKNMTVSKMVHDLEDDHMGRAFRKIV
jgi:hypothetical protein